MKAVLPSFESKWKNEEKEDLEKRTLLYVLIGGGKNGRRDDEMGFINTIVDRVWEDVELIIRFINYSLNRGD